jgi:hypothetical protein
MFLTCKNVRIVRPKAENLLAASPSIHTPTPFLVKALKDMGIGLTICADWQYNRN